MQHPVILITGFGPFPGVETNASARLVPMVAKAARRRFPSYRVRPEILPTEWERAPQRLGELDERVRPAIALHFGVASEANGFVLETRGLNHCRPAADAAGVHPSAQYVVAGAAAEHGASLDLVRALSHLHRLGLPACLSDDAGGYLCNAILYHSLHIARTRAPRRIVGFVHIPSRIGAEGEAGGLTWADAERGALEIVTVAIEQHRRAREAGHTATA